MEIEDGVFFQSWKDPGERTTSHFKQFKNYVLSPFLKGLCNLKMLK
jgi:hypothetical protein